MDKTNPQNIDHPVGNAPSENDDMVMIPHALTEQKMSRKTFNDLVNSIWHDGQTVKENLEQVVAKWEASEKQKAECADFDSFFEAFLNMHEEQQPNLEENLPDQDLSTNGTDDCEHSGQNENSSDNNSEEEEDDLSYEADVFVQFANDTEQTMLMVQKDCLIAADYKHLLVCLQRPFTEKIKFPLTVEISASYGMKYNRLYVDIDKLTTPDTCRVSVPTQKLFDGIDMSDSESNVQLTLYFFDSNLVLLGFNECQVLKGMIPDHLVLTKVCLCKSSSPSKEVEEKEYISLAADTLSNISPRFYFDVKTSCSFFEDDFHCILRDDTGRYLCSSLNENSVSFVQTDKQIEMSFLFGDFCNCQWEKGFYQIELRWLDELVAKIRFEVDSRDICGTFDAVVAQHRTGSGSCKIVRQVDGALQQLNQMVGLKNVKKVVHSLSKLHRLSFMRESMGLPVKKIPLHVWFTGRPGTGKTTVAKLMGQIYKDMGLLSSGHVVYEERRTLIGRYYDSELRETERALQSAKGGVLFIDEAYSLYVKDDDKDPGHKVLETLLTALSDEENRDWMLILSGYPKEMEDLMNSNPGLKSRLSFRLDFEDYDPGELMSIADLYCTNNQYILTSEARQRLESVIRHDYSLRDANFGNGRYVINLLEQQVIPNMASRLCTTDTEMTKEQLSTIEAEDITVTDAIAVRDAVSGFDEVAIHTALDKLDELVGLEKVKSSIHKFVELTRYRSVRDQHLPDATLLRWNFVGNTGTGKSTVAQLLADILAAMGLLPKGNMVELKAEQFYNMPEYKTEEVLRTAITQAQHGLLFIDGDAPAFKTVFSDCNTGERLLLKLNSLSADTTACGAVVLAECESPKHFLGESLVQCGIYDFDHTLFFEDYDAEQLYAILCSCLSVRKVHFSNQAREKMQTYLQSLCENRDLSYANARTMKLLADALLNIVDLRVICHPSTPADEILYEDVQSFEWKRPFRKIGF